jgi:hypothetical protein
LLIAAAAQLFANNLAHKNNLFAKNWRNGWSSDFDGMGQ